ncbi:DUF4258 domain-containing protein [Deinococcus lacus]|uniref:DUF4258 domain-containing protein n=1 Tax=Deinococcus lacus TaxID=392561 RepID=A0ABW1YGD9_9DEIO
MTVSSSTEMLLALRAQLGRLEREQKRAAKEPPRPAPQKAVKPQREADLEGIDLSDFSLGSAHARLREAVFEARYSVKDHAVGHARAEGFLEHDITGVLMSGRVRAVYPEERRWLVCGYFEACGVKLPLHVVVEHHRDGWVDVVTAFVPKNPHHIISRARLAVLLRYDEQQVRSRRSAAGNKVGYRGKGRWR